ncbi:peptidylprolyl isomerase [Sphingomonas sp.]|uniref:peptidylprolyl isomerase n=1 Tax=Sphingomonas sp. TaxID=28214 RepID=UPI00286B798E|nr:peptidylprolyl isomerase [Sphingomonas sp.]
MTNRIILAALFAAVAAPGLAQLAPPTPAAVAPKADLVRVAIDTDKGRILVALDRGRAPLTTANFLAYVDKHWFDAQPFYRAVTFGDGGLIQGGVRDGAKQLPPIIIERTATTGLRNQAGAIVMANAGGKTTRNDFFILTTDAPSFDSTATDPGFAPFGMVVEGMDVVKAIFAAPRSPTRGVGAMKGQMLDPAVKMVKVVRVK